MTKTVDVEEARAQLPELVSLALGGDEVIITEGDKPVARLVPVAAAQKRVAGLHMGVVAWMSEDFDEPLPDEFWLGGKE